MAQPTTEDLLTQILAELQYISFLLCPPGNAVSDTRMEQAVKKSNDTKDKYKTHGPK